MTIPDSPLCDRMETMWNNVISKTIRRRFRFLTSMRRVEKIANVNPKVISRNVIDIASPDPVRLLVVMSSPETMHPMSIVPE